MNEALPRWRTFTSPTTDPRLVNATDPRPSSATAMAAATGRAAPSGPIAGSSAAARAGSPATRTSVALVTAALGGAAAGAALALLGLVMLDIPAGRSGDLLGLATGVPAGSSLTSSPDGDALPGIAGALGALEDQDIVVDVTGAVARPGLHRLEGGDRVADAIAAAGGYAPRADLAATAGSLNLAELLVDGAKVVVPELGNEGSLAVAAGDPRVDLNTADQAALESLPGIGPVTAGKIMAARSERPFASVDELLARGILGQAVYDDISDQVRVSA